MIEFSRCLIILAINCTHIISILEHKYQFFFNISFTIDDVTFKFVVILVNNTQFLIWT